MDIDVFSRAELPTVMRVLRTALNPLGATLAPVERRFLRTYAFISGEPEPMADPPPIAATEVAIAGSQPRKRLLQLAGLAVLLARPVRADSAAFLRDLAHRLGVHDGVVDVADALSRGQRMRARFEVVRRGMRVFIREAYQAEGPMGVLRMYAAMLFKRRVNKDRLWEFKRLGLLQDGTLGRTYWQHMTEVGFGFPGETAGIPAALAYHDVAHVLAGNAITPLGEIQQASFQAGNRREDGYFFLLFAILQFHQGVTMNPSAETAEGMFEPDLVLWAVHRGACCNVDMTHQWDFWPLMALPLPEARHHVGLLPKLEVPA